MEVNNFMKIQTNDLVGAKSNIEYGLANVKDDMKRAFYESQQPYETSMKAALLCLKGLLTFTENRNTNVDAAIKLMNDALAIDPNFNLAKVSRQGLENQKELNISLGDSIKTKDSIINALKKQSTQKTSSIDCEKKVLIVYNNTDKMRFFSYTHIESGKGSVYPISPKSNLVKELEGNVV